MHTLVRAYERKAQEAAICNKERGSGGIDRATDGEREGQTERYKERRKNSVAESERRRRLARWTEQHRE